MKKTPLYDVHVKLKGRMVSFAGWEMPVQYTGILPEHTAVRTAAGIFDLSHMGEFEVTGTQAGTFIQSMVTNDVAQLSDGKILYSPMCNEQGGVVDDILVYRLTRERFMLVVNASNTEKDLDWLEQHIGAYDAVIADKSDAYALVAVQGPGAEKIIRPLADLDVTSIKYYWFKEAAVCGIPVMLSRTGYTGEDGFEIYVPSGEGINLWESIMASAGKDALLPVGLGARDSLRLEAGFSLYGHELDDKTSPLEAGLAWTVKMDKENFIGREMLNSQKKAGCRKKLICFMMEDSSIPRHGYRIDCGSTGRGNVTSGSFSPTFRKGIGMGYVPAGVTADARLDIEVRGAAHTAKVVKRPFYKREI